VARVSRFQVEARPFWFNPDGADEHGDFGHWVGRGNPPEWLRRTTMETYPVDIDPGQVARWVKAECVIAPSPFKITARRRQEVREIPVRAETHLDDAEREDLTEVATIATLDIAPVHASDGWLLSVVVEDEVGPRVSNGDTSGDAEQQIDLGTFYKEFIRPGRGTANVIAEVEDPAAKKHLARLIKAIETNRHGADRGALRR
jgi:hypothetical protein